MPQTTRRSVLQKGASTASLVVGGLALTGSAAASSTDYRIVIEADGSDEGQYQFKIPYNDDFESVSDQDGDEDDERITIDEEDDEIICSGEVEANGEDHWEATSDRPTVTKSWDCTVHIYEKS